MSTALVVGGGVIGVSAAYYLARRGVAVTLIEQHDVAAGSSYGNAGLVVPSHSIPLAAPGVLWKGLRWMLDPESPFYIRPRPDPALARWLWRFRAAATEAHVERALPLLRRLHEASLALYRELVTLPGFDFGFREDGGLAVYRTPEGLAEGVAEARRLEAAGLPVEVLDGDAARALEPALTPGVVGAIRHPTDAHLVPDAFVRGLAARCEALGVRIARDTEVLAFRGHGRQVLVTQTTRGGLAADLVVLAAGSWSPALARTLRLDLPVQPAKGYSVTHRRPAGAPARPLLLGEARVAVTPMGEWLRFAGTLELAGMDLSVDRRRVGALIRSVGRYVRDTATLEPLEVWRGLRPVTPDGLPLLGRPHAWDNLVVATGHAMLGMSLGPITGLLVAELATGGPTTIDLAALAPDRFA